MQSPDLAALRDDPEWMPHRIDWQRREVEFVRIPAARLSEAGFLFEFQAESANDTARIPLEAIAAETRAPQNVHFIFHTAFCRSTLLVRALNIPGHSIGLSEPPIIADLAAGGEAARPVIAPLLGLLARPRQASEAVFVKPTNHANRLIPQLLDAAPNARAILMTNPVEPFLRSVRKRGLMGHRWGRKLFLELQSYAGIDFGMPPEETFAMTDLQTAGAAWLLNQHYFAQISTSRFGKRVRILDGEAFNARRDETIAAALQFCGISGGGAGATKPSQETFATHAKTGAPIGRDEHDQKLEAEIAQVRQWLDMIAGQIGQKLPLAQTLG